MNNFWIQTLACLSLLCIRKGNLKSLKKELKTSSKQALLGVTRKMRDLKGKKKPFLLWKSAVVNFFSLWPAGLFAPRHMGS